MSNFHNVGAKAALSEQHPMMSPDCSKYMAIPACIIEFPLAAYFA